MRFFQGPSSLVRLCTSALLIVNNIGTGVAYDLQPESKESIKDIAKQLAEDMLTFYRGNEPGFIPGVLPEPPYFWWEGGAMWGALIEYWYYTKDDSFVDITKQGLLFQVGDEWDYMPRNQTLTEGNDDQGFWGLAVMAAAEYNFPHPKTDEPQWLALAQAVFNTQAPRWDTEHCGGGLRWQIYNWNKGWDYKNSISQGTFFALAARLALFTGNETYADWAVKTWDWMIALEFIDENNYVYDGAHIPNNCTEIIPYQFSYNAGVFINGASAMYNYTGDKVWKDRLDGLLDGAKVFFTGPEKDIMEEVACEPVDRCNIDQQSFKAYLSRWLASTMQWYPETYDTLMPYIRSSALAATKQCTGGDNGRMCGMKWSSGKYDGSTGVGQQMAALEVTLALMIRDRDPILTSHTGGESEGDPGLGSGDIGRTDPPGPEFTPIGAGERAGAAILTASLIGSLLAGIVWLFLDETSDKSPFEQMKGFKSSAIAAFAAFIPAATAGGVGTAAVLRKRNTRDFQTASSPEPSMAEPVDIASPLRVSRVEHMTPRHSRRASNMPLGWPHNPSLRGSAMFEPDQMNAMFSDSARSWEAQEPRAVSSIEETNEKQPNAANIALPLTPTEGSQEAKVPSRASQRLDDEIRPAPRQ